MKIVMNVKNWYKVYTRNYLGIKRIIYSYIYTSVYMHEV